MLVALPGAGCRDRLFCRVQFGSEAQEYTKAPGPEVVKTV